MDTKPQALASERTGDIVTIEHVRFSWPGRQPFTMSIEAFGLPRAKRVLLIGPSGSGKSTFLSLLCGIVAADAGRIEVLGQDLNAMTGGARDQFRAEHFGIIFQMFNLLPYGSVRDNVMLPLRFAPGRRARASERGTAEQEAERLLATLGLKAHAIETTAAARLSVGQQQRVAAARALIGRPELIVADEPTSSLDRGNQAAFLDLLFAEAQATGATILMVSHDETLAHRFDEVRLLTDFAATATGVAA
jgi:putative ABC transport system ATP-binding protein